MQYLVKGRGQHIVSLFNRPGVAGAVLQTPSVLHSFIHSAFSSESFRRLQSQTIRAMSHVTCHMSHTFLLIQIK